MGNAKLEQKRDTIEYIIGGPALVTLREYEYLGTYGHKDVVISLKKDSAGESNMSKLTNGQVSKFFYGFLNEEGTKVVKWTLFNGNMIGNRIMAGYISFTKKNNIDTGEPFAVINLEDIQECVIDSSDHHMPVDCYYQGFDGYIHTASIQDGNKFHSASFAAGHKKEVWNQIERYVNSNYKFGCQVNIYNQVTNEVKVVHVQPF